MITLRCEKKRDNFNPVCCGCPSLNTFFWYHGEDKECKMMSFWITPLLIKGFCKFHLLLLSDGKGEFLEKNCLRLSVIAITEIVY